MATMTMQTTLPFSNFLKSILTTPYRKRKTFYVYVTAACSIFLFGSFLVSLRYSLTSQESPATWRSRTAEEGFLRVMRYIEREGEVDGVIRDAFIDRVWRNVKIEVFRDLYKSKFINNISESVPVNHSVGENTVAEYLSYIENDHDNIEKAFEEYIDKITYFENEKITPGLDKKKELYRTSMKLKSISLVDRKLESAREEIGQQSSPSLLLTKASPPKLVDLGKFLSRSVINQLEFSYKYEQSNACVNGTTQILIAVPSAPGNFERRQNVRKSELAKFDQNPQNRAKLLFFIGIPDPSSRKISENTQAAIDQEQRRHGDIVQATFVDIYPNIFKKAAHVFHWSSQHCREAKFLIRIDDDVSVDINRIMEAMELYKPKYDHFILGKMRVNWKPLRDIHSKYVKYLLYLDDYPYKYFPPFLLGGALGYPMKTTHLLLEAMKRLPIVWLDDVFVTGVCARKLGIPIFDNTAFYFEHEDLL